MMVHPGRSRAGDLRERTVERDRRGRSTRSTDWSYRHGTTRRVAPRARRDAVRGHGRGRRGPGTCSPRRTPDARTQQDGRLRPTRGRTARLRTGRRALSAVARRDPAGAELAHPLGQVGCSDAWGARRCRRLLVILQDRDHRPSDAPSPSRSTCAAPRPTPSRGAAASAVGGPGSRCSWSTTSARGSDLVRGATPRCRTSSRRSRRDRRRRRSRRDTAARGCRRSASSIERISSCSSHDASGVVNENISTLSN